MAKKAAPPRGRRAADQARLDKHGLEPKQRRFADEWMVSHNGTEAALKAGYGKTRGSACELGHRLLENPAVAAYIEGCEKVRAAKLGLQADDVAREWARIGFSDIRRLFSADGATLLPPAEWPDDIARAVAGVDVVVRGLGDGAVEYVKKIKLWDKNAALGNAAKHLGMMLDRGELALTATPTLAKLLQMAAAKASRKGAE